MRASKKKNVKKVQFQFQKKDLQYNIQRFPHRAVQEAKVSAEHVVHPFHRSDLNELENKEKGREKQHIGCYKYFS